MGLLVFRGIFLDCRFCAADFEVVVGLVVVAAVVFFLCSRFEDPGSLATWATGAALDARKTWLVDIGGTKMDGIGPMMRWSWFERKRQAQYMEVMTRTQLRGVGDPPVAYLIMPILHLSSASAQTHVTR
jgi:hypothetical protein